MKQTVKKVAKRALGRARMMRTAVQVRRLVGREHPLKLELGAGAKRGRDGWLTLDTNPESDLYWDLLRGLPFSDHTAGTIYSSHLLEHFSFREIQALLAECLRVLQPGGLFSICVPNAEIWLAAYANPASLDKEKYCEYGPALFGSSGIDYVNYIAYMDGHHRYMFDRENLVSVLDKAGFVNARLRKFDPELDMGSRKDTSIYAEAWKSIDPKGA